ncbi:MAG: hypothetical protein JNM90_25790 [Burkholderiales bacterium]|nr:hypothetical protein [Burkholderiales bacterium]
MDDPIDDKAVPERLEVAGWQEAVDLFFENDWTDGLPIVPPTDDLVRAMLAGVPDRDPEEVIGTVPPRWAQATVRVCAVNAVMAGCTPAWMPILLAAVEAVLEPGFNLAGIQATTHSATPLIVVSGPDLKRLGINAGYNAMGQGFRANATIGRALRLIMINVGGGRPGQTDLAQFGSPGKFGFLLAENDAASPWEPYRVEHGFDVDDTIVAAFSAEGPHSVTNHVATDTFGIGTSIASCMSTLGSNNAYGMGEVVVVLGPEHAEFFRKEKWSKDDLRLYLYQKARNRIGDLMFERRYGSFYNRMWPKWFDRTRDAEEVPVVVRPDDIHIFVAGGPAGRFSTVIPGWGGLGGRSVIRKVRAAAPSAAAPH